MGNSIRRGPLRTVQNPIGRTNLQGVWQSLGRKRRLFGMIPDTNLRLAHS
jgi:hypothetical protein